jgi:hypothetical protein
VTVLSKEGKEAVALLGPNELVVYVCAQCAQSSPTRRSSPSPRYRGFASMPFSAGIILAQAVFINKGKPRAAYLRLL